MKTFIIVGGSMCVAGTAAAVIGLPLTPVINQGAFIGPRVAATAAQGGGLAPRRPLRHRCRPRRRGHLQVVDDEINEVKTFQGEAKSLSPRPHAVRELRLSLNF